MTSCEPYSRLSTFAACTDGTGNNVEHLLACVGAGETIERWRLRFRLCDRCAQVFEEEPRAFTGQCCRATRGHGAKRREPLFLRQNAAVVRAP